MSISTLNLPIDIAEYGFWHKLVALPFVEAVYLFGSRARGDARPKSDIDLAINCPSASFQQWQKVLDIVEEADTLLGIDVVRYDHLGDCAFRHKIDQNKVVVYENRNA
ncbi:nucleotidyltransferase family protein [Marinomonas shanghaiensis]|jgi:uncharacterized protein|uniref:nucleotidyltransferase family protein n=1 Tax=Marinomonas shanghaiensis TaxID=2202418 RepID=UPI000DB9E078|nr:nucleotidyltransferase domain-containing protein [Marinomonas shanghaiensis]